MSKHSNKTVFYKDSRFYFLLLPIILSVVLMVQLFMVNIIPMKYSLIIIVVLILLCGALFYLLYNKRISKLNRILGKCIIVVLSIALCFGNFYIFKGAETLRNISSANVKTNAISVIVLKDNLSADNDDLNLLKDGNFGVLNSLDRNNTNLAVENINEKLKLTINQKDFETPNDLAQSLYDKNIDAMILNEAYRGMLEDQYPKFDSETKVIYQYEIQSEVLDFSKDVEITKTPFNLYISGIDSYGSVSVVSRTDVNMIATINPTTHQILLTSIPRDYYIPQTCQGNQNDKLTHTGIFGVDCSVSSLENFFNIDINYYARVNFSSLINIVDSLGNITVDNPRAFTDDNGYFFGQGAITLDGVRALAFSRDRHNQPEGDRDRGKNQMRVITGIINKAISPSIITNYSSVMSVVGGSFETNMSSNDLSKFIQKQLEDMSGWDIVQNAVNGSGSDNTWSPANGFNSYVMIPDMTTVENAKNLMKQVMNGEIISVSQ